MSELSPSAIKEFDNAVIKYLTPLAKDFGFNFEQIDPCLFMLTSESISIKVYFPESHGYDVDIKITPIPSKDWYSPQEKPIDWVGQFLGLGEFFTGRGSAEEHIANLVKVNVNFLRQVLPLLIPVQKNFWDDLSFFIQEQVAKEEERSKDWAEEQQLSEIRQRIEVSWRTKDYAQVISLFEEIKGKMSVAEIKKMEYARKHVA